eukprot:176315-Chlamydomonas_euryale.AAC.3
MPATAATATSPPLPPNPKLGIGILKSENMRSSLSNRRHCLLEEDMCTQAHVPAATAITARTCAPSDSSSSATRASDRSRNSAAAVSAAASRAAVSAATASSAAVVSARAASR